jgi:ribosomal protein S25
MNAWTVLIGTLAVDRKPVPVAKKRESRAVTNMTRKEICAYAAKHMRAKRRELKDRARDTVYALTIRPITAYQVVAKLGISKTYTRVLLIELVDEGLLVRNKGASGHYWYERKEEK